MKASDGACMLMRHSRKERRNLCQHFVHDRCWQGIHLVSTACGEIQRTWLVAAYDTCCLDAAKGNRKADSSSKVITTGNGHNHRTGCEAIECLRGYDQHWPLAALLMSCCWLKINHINIAAFHQISSFPTAGASIHSRSSAGSGYTPAASASASSSAIV